MPLINTSLPNLIQGVSQQPDALRYDGQCEEQENALSSVVDGLTKRPNTRHVARLLEEAISADSFVHFINRDDNEKYVVIHDGTKLRVFNLKDGAEATINGSLGGLSISGSYLNTVASPTKSIKGLSVGDSTFLVNTETTVQESSSLTPSQKEEALVTVRQGDYSKNYSISVSDLETSGTSGTQASFSIGVQESFYAAIGPSGTISTIVSGSTYDFSGQYSNYALPVSIAINGANGGGSGYPANLVDDTSTVKLRFTNHNLGSNYVGMLQTANVNSLYGTLPVDETPLKISTDANGTITSVAFADVYPSGTGNVAGLPVFHMPSAATLELVGPVSATASGTRSVTTG